MPELLCSFNGIGGIALILTKSEIKVFGHKYDVCKQIGKGSIILLGGSDDVKEARRVFLDEYTARAHRCQKQPGARS